MDPNLTPAALRKLRRSLLAWYDQNRRELPWRRDADPYRVWVSEIMLQQTRVAAVVDHYARFLQKFPTVQILAAAREASVLAVWSGLGYYHRARRLHQAAKVIARQRGGSFPRTAEAWQQTPRHWTLHRGSHRQHCLQRACGRSGRQRRTCTRPHVRTNCGKGSRVAAGGVAPRTRASRRLQPGDDGVGCDNLHTASAAMPGVSAA